MSFLKKLFSGTAKEISDSAGAILDKVITTDHEKLKLKNELSNIVLTSLNSLYSDQKEVLKAELSGNALQRNWRPIVMLSFTGLLLCRWTGILYFPIDKDLELKLFDLLEIGLGGYVIGRSAEKITKSLSENLDLSLLRKKDRKDQIH